MAQSNHVIFFFCVLEFETWAVCLRPLCVARDVKDALEVGKSLTDNAVFATYYTTYAFVVLT